MDDKTLVERLRDRGVCSIAQNSCRNDYICEEAATHIEALEAALRKPDVWPSEQLDAMVRAFDENSKKHGLRETLMAVVNAANRYTLEGSGND